MKPEQLEAEIMKLSLDARAKLAERIILSLDAPSDEENLGLWVLEAERRLKDLREGKAKEVPAEEVFRRARAAILCGEITFHEEADSEVYEAALYYEGRAPNLGLAFLDETEKTSRRILADPMAYRSVGDEVRQAPVARFPYSVL